MVTVRGWGMHGEMQGIGNGREQEQVGQGERAGAANSGTIMENTKRCKAIQMGDIEPDPRANTLQRLLLIFSAALPF